MTQLLTPNGFVYTDKEDYGDDTGFFILAPSADCKCSLCGCDGEERQLTEEYPSGEILCQDDCEEEDCDCEELNPELKLQEYRCAICMKKEEEEEEQYICCVCKRDFTDEVDGRPSAEEWEETGIICVDCFDKKEGYDKDKEDPVCCVACGEEVCKFEEEPPHKDRKGEAVCEDCFAEHFREKQEEKKSKKRKKKPPLNPDKLLILHVESGKYLSHDKWSLLLDMTWEAMDMSGVFIACHTDEQKKSVFKKMFPIFSKDAESILE
tara:strand:+ start:130 stop:924 length:795 start_codon:yes stop_codon:yes gene_type:complete